MTFLEKAADFLQRAAEEEMEAERRELLARLLAPGNDEEEPPTIH